MKGFLALLLLVFIALFGYNAWQIQQLRQEVAQLNIKVEEQRQNTSTTDQLVATATQALAQARQAVGNTDWEAARKKLETATTTLAQAGRTASDKAAPTVKWLEGQAADLSKQVQDRIRAAR